MSNAMLPEQATEIPEKQFEVPAVPAPPIAPPLANDLAAASEYDYKPIPMLAPVALFLGISSLVVLVTYFGLVIAGLGTVIGTICLLSIWKNRSEVGGFKMTIAGLSSSVVCLIAGSASLVHAYRNEVPEGFQRISFNADISKKGFGIGYAGQTLHPDVVALDGKKIFVKGFMYPTRHTEGITEFVLAKDNGQCCFGGQPQITDMIYVRLKTPLKFDYTEERVSLAGTFHAGASNKTEEGLSPVYELDAVYIGQSRTAF